MIRRRLSVSNSNSIPILIPVPVPDDIINKAQNIYIYIKIKKNFGKFGALALQVSPLTMYGTYLEYIHVTYDGIWIC